MQVTKIAAENFKSFGKIEYAPAKLNVIIGANASGKSNLISIFKFINNIYERGIDDAISLSGGMEYLKSHTSGVNDLLKVSIELLINERFRVFIDDNYSYKPTKLSHNISIKPKKGKGYRIVSEVLTVHLDFYGTPSHKELNSDKPVCSFVCSINRENDKFENIIRQTDESTCGKEIQSKIENILKFVSNSCKRNRDSLLYSSKLFLLLSPKSSILKIYDFDPKILKKSSNIEGIRTLTEDGSNFALVLKDLKQNKKKYESLLRQLEMLLPFVADIKVKADENKNMTYVVREKYVDKDYPSGLISDGTVNIIALIISSLIENDNQTIVLEEPEKNIHPGLISRFMEMLAESSKGRQIIITTHSPDIVGSVAPENVVFIRRNNEGLSEIIRPLDDADVQTLLKNELGLRDLFEMDLIS